MRERETTVEQQGGPVGVPSEMNALEAMMWRAEVDPRLRSTVTIVDVLDSVPDWDRLVDAHEWATHLIPRLRERVLEPYWGWGPPEWVPDPHFALGFHVRRQHLPEGAGMRELLDHAALLAMSPVDRERAPWEAVLVTGLDGGRAAYVLKVHHSLADGVGLMQILGLLHSPVREHVADKPDYPVLPPEAPSRLGLTTRRLGGLVRALPSTALGAAMSGAGLAGRLVTRPVSTVTDTAAFVASAARAAIPPAVRGSELLRGRSLNRRFEALDVDFAALRAAGRAAGGSVNDAYLAAVLGGLARYHRRSGEVPASVPLGMPVNTRDDADPLGGNHWAGKRFAAPLDELDPAARIREIRAIVQAVTGERVNDALGLIAPVLASLPAPLLAQVQGGATMAIDVQVSNVPGMRGPVYLAGAEIVRSYPFAPLPGAAAMIALTSHAGTCCVAVNLDPAAITDPDSFRTDLEAGFAEVLALGE
ncbi:WS/DGAT domain-containing protein [Actinomycetospora endophytica]|uniref:diacylglycerol O-acyltransferase n=1 Tax=Actinomycetospora endophytica TaxID=2291215 RepID=A0ABS8PBS5_9PSEU|nr:wax ester/triacylglycerol synthase domain-containing protein [Actinomycetospora endophytica]MCD2195749.1 WS/DGAT domain-containing protein [Actinomycetospora endophytica]